MRFTILVTSKVIVGKYLEKLKKDSFNLDK